MRVLLCNCAPDQAESLAQALVREGRAACVNLLPAVRSFYIWDGELQDGTEATLLIKVGDEAVEACVERLKALHRYDVPEILVLPVEVERSHGAYVDWVRHATGGTP